MAIIKSILISEQKYWYSVVYNYLSDMEDFRHPEAATQGLLDGTHLQDMISDDIEYPVLRWREIEAMK